jgi:hypothetical protein
MEDLPGMGWLKKCSKNKVSVLLSFIKKKSFRII